MSLIKVPPHGAKIAPNLAIPDNPIIPFIEGDGIGADITPVMIEVVDAAVQKAYGGARKIHWMEVYCGKKATRLYGDDTYLPQETLNALKEYIVSIKGPLATPDGKDKSSLDLALRKQLGLHIGMRPIRWLKGIPSPFNRPDLVNLVVFRENTGNNRPDLEPNAISSKARKIIDFLQAEMGVTRISTPDSTSNNSTSPTKADTEYLLRKAIQYAIDKHRKSVTFVHQSKLAISTGNLPCQWVYDLTRNEFGGTSIEGSPFLQLPNGIVVKEAIADTFLQQFLYRPAEYDVVAALHSNGDYLCDALSTEVGGIGIAPGAHFSDNLICFEATHSTVPKYAGQNKANPCSIILSAEMMLRHLGWSEAADLIIKGSEAAFAARLVTYDFARLMKEAREVSCSDFGKAIIEHM